jgi:iron-sulfur cluster repair protein YtfE (RIC family)
VALELPHAARVLEVAGRERVHEAPHTLREAPLTKVIAYVVDRHHVFTRGELLREMREAAGLYAPPPDACDSYRALYAALAEFEADLHQHIFLENSLLFPRAVEMEARA